MTGTATAFDPDLARLHELGRALDLAAGLAAMLDGLDPRTAAPDGVALLPVSTPVPDARILPHPFAARDGLMLVRFPRPSGASGQGRGLTGPRAAALAAVRIGLLSGLLDAAAHRLAGRTFAGTRLIDQQLVVGAVADVLTELDLAAAARLDADTAAEVAAAQHERLTEAGWTVARFFGAEGYLADHPVRSLYLSALAADVWLPRPSDAGEGN
jgi:hypothetical protein